MRMTKWEPCGMSLFRQKIQKHARENRVDVRVIDKKDEKAFLIEMSCPWIDDGVVKVEEKTRYYGPFRLGLKKQWQGYQITQYNIVMDVLGGYSEEVREFAQSLVRERSEIVLKNMQEAMLTNILKIATSMKNLNQEEWTMSKKLYYNCI